jgi:HSP20 family protein
VGHFSRSFTLSNQIDTTGIEANIADGVLTLNLPKVKEAKPRKITIN